LGDFVGDFKLAFNRLQLAVNSQNRRHADNQMKVGRFFVNRDFE